MPPIGTIWKQAANWLITSHIESEKHDLLNTKGGNKSVHNDFFFLKKPTILNIFKKAISFYSVSAQQKHVSSPASWGIYGIK